MKNGKYRLAFSETCIFHFIIFSFCIYFRIFAANLQFIINKDEDTDS